MSDSQLVGRSPLSARWRSFAFLTLPDGRTYLHDGGRVTPKIGDD